MQSHFFNRYVELDPFLDETDARSLVQLCEDFGSYGMYSEEGLNDGIGEGLPQRFDAAFNFVRTGGRLGLRDSDLGTLVARTNYFRETYAYGDEIFAPGIEALYQNQRLIEAAREIFGRPIIEPAIVYANLLLPGQELAVHTDVPEFRGLNRKLHPQWLIVVAHHSGLFDDYRMPIATSVSWYQDTNGGEFAFYPDGIDAPARAYDVHFNTAVIMDTDSVFHGVDRVTEIERPIPKLLPRMRLYPEGDGNWVVRDGDEQVDRYRWEDMRFSISWKAYCFSSESERDAWRNRTNDLDANTVLDTLCADLKKRGRIQSDRPSNRALAELLVDQYVKFPLPSMS
ncbi:MAG: hypothetical protein HKN10_01190 [Myxococcales bacterium]|nr:hypothetical protein [Myxococcales bacterium]